METFETAASEMVISFSNSKLSTIYKQCHGNEVEEDHDVSSGDLRFLSDVLVPQAQGGTRAGKGVSKGKARSPKPPSELQDHVLAERRRREKLNELFIALSAIVPGLKKMDKSSILGEAVKHIKQLKEQVKTLEERAAWKPYKGSKLVGENGDYSELSPEIEVKVCDKNVLLRIHCEKHNGFVVKALSEVEKLNLTVTRTSAMPFGGLAMDITIIAQMEGEVMEAEDISRTLLLAFFNEQREFFSDFEYKYEYFM